MYGVAHDWTKCNIFWELPYRKDNLFRHNLDVIHIEKNYYYNLFNTVMDVTGKTKVMLRLGLINQNIVDNSYLSPRLVIHSQWNIREKYVSGWRA